MKIHQIISIIGDFICIPDIAGELDTVLPHIAHPWFAFFSARHDVLAVTLAWCLPFPVQFRMNPLGCKFCRGDSLYLRSTVFNSKFLVGVKTFYATKWTFTLCCKCDQCIYYIKLRHVKVLSLTSSQVYITFQCCVWFQG
jgi:hypothetical protein